ncbi:MAG: PEP-CTERM sorting domain-containing protein, partial [Cyanobacteriota bacterium]|nr:PEP-CTERM sorting domain-containing protein [Cyanobacteriota bacterium]
KKGAVIVFSAAVMTLGAVGSAGAATIVADTTGSDDFFDSDFYGISFLAGKVGDYIQSIVFDLRASGNPNAQFDFMPGSPDDPFGPVFGSGVGLNAGDVTFTPNNTSGSPTLTLDFAANSFGVGDSLRFGADTDFLVNPNSLFDNGGEFGDDGVGISVTLQNGLSGDAIFSKVSTTQSQATVDIPHVPEPTSTISLLALGILGAGSMLKRNH